MKTAGNNSSGINKKSFAMAYGGGEIWFEHLDSLYEDLTALKTKFDDDFKSIDRLSTPSVISVIIDDTFVSDEFAEYFVNKFCMNQRYVKKVCITSSDKKTVKNLKKIFKKYKYECRFAINFISDLEKAKDWLVSERV